MIIFCKDCKYSNIFSVSPDREGDPPHEYVLCQKLLISMRPDSYCSEAQSKL